MEPKVNIGIDRSRYTPQSEIPDADAGYGPCIRCVCTGNDAVENYNPVMPTKLGARLTLTYMNGPDLEVMVRFVGLLFYGAVPFWTDDARFCNISDKCVRAAIAKAAAELRPFGEGEVKLPTEEEADAILAEYVVPERPIDSDHRPGIEEAWFRAWKDDGLLVEMSDGQWVIESALPDVFEDDKFATWKYGREWRFQGAGGIVRLCNDCLVAHGTRFLQFLAFFTEIICIVIEHIYIVRIYLEGLLICLVGLLAFAKLMIHITLCRQ